jgi:hypothetical protein
MIQLQQSDRGKDYVFTSNTYVSVIDQMKNEEGNGPHQRRGILGAIGHKHSIRP